jgi:hypothetical protein
VRECRGHYSNQQLITNYHLRERYNAETAPWSTKTASLVLTQRILMSRIPHLTFPMHHSTIRSQRSLPLNIVLPHITLSPNPHRTIQALERPNLQIIRIVHVPALRRSCQSHHHISTHTSQPIKSPDSPSRYISIIPDDTYVHKFPLTLIHPSPLVALRRRRRRQHFPSSPLFYHLPYL